MVVRFLSYESGGHEFLACDAVVVAGACGGGEGELPLGRGGVAGSGVLPGRDQQDGVLVEVAAPGVFLAVGMPLGAAVGEAGLAELGEGDRVAMKLGEEMAAIAQHVGPPVEAKL